MDENFDIDEHINKIKSQMNDEFKEVNDPDNSMFRQSDDNSLLPPEIMENLPNNEPSLAQYSSVEDTKQETASDTNATDEAQSESHKEEVVTEIIPHEEWKDPFGGIYENDAVKKYVLYISKDFVPYIDDLDTDARSAFVNEALQIKTDLDKKDERMYVLIRMLKHSFVSALVLIISIPCLFWLANKSIMATSQNYSYVQKNFEQLYKTRIEREKNINKLDLKSLKSRP